MKNNFINLSTVLTETANKFDEEACLKKNRLLKSLNNCALPINRSLLHYHDTLLFLCAFPNQPAIVNLAEKELNRLSLHLKNADRGNKLLPENEGLPYLNTVTRFTPDFLKWLTLHRDITVSFDSFYDSTISLNELLNITLPTLLRSETTAGLSNEELLEVLKIKPRQYIRFLSSQMEQLNEMPFVKDLLMEKLNVYVKLLPKNPYFSRAYNRLPVKNIFYQQNLLKHFDHEQLFLESIPKETLLTKQEKLQVIKVIKNSMALTNRETDPATFMQEDSLKLFTLERGINIAFYGMIPERQMPLESYVGFTLFKNGFPVSYGGAWIFGRAARIGINIFETFRGGESGYIMCQLLRTYKQVFKISYFEVEPYQYGLDNPDGIKTGAFWYYYRYGFRPVDKQLQRLAKTEQEKITTRMNYRSSEKTLLRFTESNMVLNMGKKIHVQVETIAVKLKSFLKNKYQNDYLTAEKDAIQLFCKQTGIHTDALNTIEKKVLAEVAFWVFSMNITNHIQLQRMKEMVHTKPRDLYAYQELLLDLFEEE